MDKKHINTRQGSSKALSSDTRKSSDSFTTKTVQRNPRRRENSTSTTSKNDLHRNNKPVLGKTRPNVDKRTKPRGNYGTTPSVESASSASSRLATDDILSVGYTSNESNESEIDLNCLYNPGSKKQNFNHLLNFHYSSQHVTTMMPYNFADRQRFRCSNFKKSKYNKEQYLQANFQFVINSTNETHLLQALPDTLIDWNFIEQINIQTTDEPQCPICLYPPVAAKLTRCGHAYCWPCILHYLSLSDKSWRKCPICYEAVHLHDLKSTAIVQQAIYNVGSVVSFQLMRRKKGSMLIEKDKTHGISTEQIPHLTTKDERKHFSKFLLADRSEILSIIEREKKELESGDDLNCPESVFIEQALLLLQERKDSLMSKDVNPPNLIKKNTMEIISSVTVECDEQGETGGDMQDAINALSDDRHGASSAKVDTKFYYFYQSVDGQNIFLHPLNVKMLKAMYGTLNEGPEIINGKIVQKELHSMTDDLRKKFRCLEYLPLSCQFEVVEIQLDTPYVSELILDIFKDEILIRQKTRLRREKEEKKREKEIDRINERQMGKLIASSANIDIKSDHQFPICGFEEPLGLPGRDLTIASGSSLSTSVNRSDYASFANIVSSKKTENWPTLESKSTASSFNYSELSTSNKPPKHKATQKPNDAEEDVDNSEVDEAASGQFSQKSLGDVLVEAIQQNKKNAKKLNPKPSSAGNGNNGGGQKKNKKNNKMLLFSTGINYNGN